MMLRIWLYLTLLSFPVTAMEESLIIQEEAFRDASEALE